MLKTMNFTTKSLRYSPLPVTRGEKGPLVKRDPITDEDGDTEKLTDLQQRTYCWDGARIQWIAAAKILLLFVLAFVLFANSVTFINSLFSYKSFDIVLFGDSLVCNTDNDYGLCSNLAKRLRAARSGFDVYVTCHASGGRKANNLRLRVSKEVLQRPAGILGLAQGRLHLPPPKAVIVYFDSDAANVNESLFNVTDLRSRYIWNLTQVASALTKEIPRVAHGGPTLCCEVTPRGSNVDDQKFDEYCDINRRICEDFNMTYLDTRSLFFSHLPSNWNKKCGYLTLDGEHHNQRGAAVVEDMFYDLIVNKWGEALFT